MGLRGNLQALAPGGEGGNVVRAYFTATSDQTGTGLVPALCLLAIGGGIKITPGLEIGNAIPQGPVLGDFCKAVGIGTEMPAPALIEAGQCLRCDSAGA